MATMASTMLLGCSLEVRFFGIEPDLGDICPMAERRPA
jgi:hypothetical protein